MGIDNCFLCEVLAEFNSMNKVSSDQNLIECRLPGIIPFIVIPGMTLL